MKTMLLLLMGLLVSTSLGATMVTVDFEDCTVGYAGAELESNGYLFTAVDDESEGLLSVKDKYDTLTLFTRDSYQWLTTMERIDGQAFDVISITIYPYSPPPVLTYGYDWYFDFEVEKMNGTAFTYRYSWDFYGPDPLTIVLDGCTDLRSIAWLEYSGYAYIDDFVTIVPEPLTIIILAGGVVIKSCFVTSNV